MQYSLVLFLVSLSFCAGAPDMALAATYAARTGPAIVPTISAAAGSRRSETAVTHELQALKQSVARRRFYCRVVDEVARRAYYSDLFSLPASRNATQLIAVFSKQFSGDVRARYAGAEGDASCFANEDAYAVRRQFHGDRYDDVVHGHQSLLSGWVPGEGRREVW
jgi:hypothetical protein